jgi:hypothetical protein
MYYNIEPFFVQVDPHCVHIIFTQEIQFENFQNQVMSLLQL